MKKKIRHFTLLEILIALSLSLIISGVLLFYYFQMSRVANLSEQATVRAFELRTLQNRLQNITLSFVKPNNRSTFFFQGSTPPGLFLSGTNTLIFSYDNGIVFDEALSNQVLGRLFVDPEKNLTLLTWVAREKWEAHVIPRFHREVLLKNVEKFSMQFLATNEEDASKAYLDLIFNQWIDHWRKEYQRLPALIRYKVQQIGQKEEIFAFPIIGPQTKVIYKS